MFSLLRIVVFFVLVTSLAARMARASRRRVHEAEQRRLEEHRACGGEPLEACRNERRLLVMAATNSIAHLDPAVIQPGRLLLSHGMTHAEPQTLDGPRRRNTGAEGKWSSCG